MLYTDRLPDRFRAEHYRRLRQCISTHEANRWAESQLRPWPTVEPDEDEERLTAEDVRRMV